MRERREGMLSLSSNINRRKGSVLEEEEEDSKNQALLLIALFFFFLEIVDTCRCDFPLFKDVYNFLSFCSVFQIFNYMIVLGPEV